MVGAVVYLLCPLVIFCKINQRYLLFCTSVVQSLRRYRTPQIRLVQKSNSNAPGIEQCLSCPMLCQQPLPSIWGYLGRLVALVAVAPAHLRRAPGRLVQQHVSRWRLRETLCWAGLRAVGMSSSRAKQAADKGNPRADSIHAWLPGSCTIVHRRRRICYATVVVNCYTDHRNIPRMLTAVTGL